MNERNYKPFSVPPDFSRTALEEALPYIGPAFVYEVRCHYADIAWMRGIVRKLMADVEGSPLAPYINLVIDDSYTRDEWSVHANDKAMGSPGAV